MYTPSLRDPGFVELVDSPLNGRFAVWDGIGTGHHRRYPKTRWFVEHVDSGAKRFHTTKRAAREDASTSAAETDEKLQWWKIEQE